MDDQPGKPGDKTSEFNLSKLSDCGRTPDGRQIAFVAVMKGPSSAWLARALALMAPAEVPPILRMFCNIPFSASTSRPQDKLFPLHPAFKY